MAPSGSVSGGAGPRTANVRNMASGLRVRELQLVLADMNLARSGRKQELIDRIVHALEQHERNASENASNHAASAFYNDQLNLGLRSLQGQVAATSTAPAPPPPPPASAHHAYGPPLPMPRSLVPPSAPQPHPHPQQSYGRPIPYNGHAHNHHRPQNGHHGMPPIPPMPAAPTPTANEILRPASPASLDGARCFCGSETASGKVVSCVQCGLRVHAKCHQLVNAPSTDDWYCEACRAALCDPFLRVRRTVLAPVFVKFHRNQVPLRIEYTINDQDLNDLYAKRDPKPGAMTAGCLELQLRCFILKEELGTGTSWPTTTVVAANGYTLPLVQRAPPGQSNPSKVLREQPANLFSSTRIGRNVVELRTSESPMVHVFMVQIVEFRDVNELVTEVRAASESITYEDAKKEVIKSFGGGDDDDEDDDDAVVATSTVLSLRCPLGLCVIDLPARGVHCKHLQCFDLKTFLMFNKKARSRHYRCTVCHNFIKASDLRIDPYLKKLLREVQGDEDLEEVEILPDATWKRRAGEESEATPPPQKRVKLEAVENGNADAAADAGLSAVTAAALAAADAAAAEGSANAPFEIDLSLSSDEEDEALGSVPTMSANTSSTATNGTGSTLSDDDVAIFTVDSDVWEMPSNGSGGVGNLPFPHDLFASFAGTNGGNPVDLSASGSWSTSTSAYSAMPSLTATTGNGNSAYAAPVTSSAATTGSEADLASAMAQISRNHPPVSATASFETRRPPPPRPAAANGGRVMDVISLLDSDSE